MFFLEVLLVRGFGGEFIRVLFFRDFSEGFGYRLNFFFEAFRVRIELWG